MRTVTRDDIDKEEFVNQQWFLQLVVWLEFVANPVPNTVIETGTHTGHGAVRFATYFDNVHTVELSEDLYNETKSKYSHIPNINFYNNSSPEFLREILSTMEERCIIFLDAHGSGGDTVYDDRYGRYGTPLLDELSAIKESSKLNNHVIVIDDCDDLGTMSYPSANEVESAIMEINSNYCVELDIPKSLLLSRGTGIAYLPYDEE